MQHLLGEIPSEEGVTVPLKLCKPTSTYAPDSSACEVAGKRKHLSNIRTQLLIELGFVVYTRRGRAATCLTPILSESGNAVDLWSSLCEPLLTWQSCTTTTTESSSAADCPKV